MKRFHAHIGVKNLDKSIAFYTSVFGEEPTKRRSDYAKWQLEEPLVNFAISTVENHEGLNHFGIQVDDDETLVQLEKQLSETENDLYEEGEVECCYARSKKTWSKDPSGIPWELFRSMDDYQVYPSPEDTEVCCTEETRGQPGCCEPSAATKGCCA